VIFQLRNPVVSDSSGPIGLGEKASAVASRPWYFRLAMAAFPGPANAAKAQAVIIFPSGSIGATGRITPENPLVGGLIHLSRSQCGSAC
jgi:hypothetical protein